MAIKEKMMLKQIAILSMCFFMSGCWWFVKKPAVPLVKPPVITAKATPAETIYLIEYKNLETAGGICFSIIGIAVFATLILVWLGQYKSAILSGVVAGAAFAVYEFLTAMVRYSVWLQRGILVLVGVAIVYVVYKFHDTIWQTLTQLVKTVEVAKKLDTTNEIGMKNFKDAVDDIQKPPTKAIVDKIQEQIKV